MSPTLHHECTRVPITALTEWGPVLVVAEGPHLRVYNRRDKTCIRSHRVFRGQAIHGISKLYTGVGHLHLIVWGGIQVRAIKISYKCDEDDRGLDYCPGIILNALSESGEARAPDWIIDICPSPTSQEQPHPGRCVAVTAHNALLEIAFQHLTSEGPPVISVKALTSSTRSILYSAHLQWESETCVLVAAGTAFGEIIYWSWDQSRDSKTRSLVHRVFLGHEGSIFGVQISGVLSIDRHGPRRLLASCSDDRTIRIWDVTDVAAETVENSHEGDSEQQRTRHTGFSNGSFDPDMSNTDCLAIGWGHTSRVWNLSFLNINSATDQSPGDVFLISSGEDATSRTWRLITEAYEPLSRPNATTWQLKLVNTAAHHNGKNIWSMSASALDEVQQYVTTGGADSKITRFSLPPSLFSGRTDILSNFSQSKKRDVTELGSISTGIGPDEQEASHRSSKQAEFFRSYAFLDECSLIFTTNSGKIYLESLSPHIDGGKNEASSSLQFIDQLEDLSGYSVCAGEQSHGMAFVAGSRGTLYMYRKGTGSLVKVNTFNGKIGEVFPSVYQSTSGAKGIVLLIILVGQKVAQLLYIDVRASDSLTILEKINVPIMDQKTGLAITSMSHIDTPTGNGILLGFRRGSIAAFSIPKRGGTNNEDVSAELIQIIDSAHGKEAVTAMTWSHKERGDRFGYLTSTGRDSCVVTHLVDLVKHTHQLVHHLTLPIGPNIEGIHIHRNQLHVYGFSSKKFVFYNTVTEEEVMSVETGGAHRTWSFNPTLPDKDGGTLVWTRASSMHTFSQREPNHTVIRSGGHGREIKAVAVSHPTSMQESSMQLIATGAEDTDIKIFTYENEHLVCLRTLRRHTTGIQCLQWSADGSYLFSSGGCEEFYIWKISRLPPELGSIGVVCEAVWSPESEHSDLRIMAFDVAQTADQAFVVSMVFSNSAVKVYSFDSTRTDRWKKMTEGLYFTSCLTQCIFVDTLEMDLPHTILTAGTDGHAVLWSMPIQEEPMLYRDPITIHQSSSKALSYVSHPDHGHIMLSGGDDGSLAFFRASSSPGAGVGWKNKPAVVVRTHASAVTACVMIARGRRVLVLTSGNDQWVRLWEVFVADSASSDNDSCDEKTGWLEVKRLDRIKTNVADVSSMAVLTSSDGTDASRVLICGVGMEIVAVQWDSVSR